MDTGGAVTPAENGTSPDSGTTPDCNTTGSIGHAISKLEPMGSNLLNPWNE
eukprot:CAMPEP_0185849140 /NCGR_PEP_ID=MMETSP1354-20130828/3749_1 /TAXON_ID=708628 /ORGANISM="Erythrolobus madagascarensis, Strain CCMP3276" /LENGTH=50 /DNA_ID=CAMNT_0028549621 /DNA_START=830 /DNA_END=982 /DNA_ORIENTATION=-